MNLPETKKSLGDRSEPAPRKFTNRDGLLRGFASTLGSANSDCPRVLAYYGVGGIGKSRLIRRLRNEPPDHREAVLLLSGTVHARVDFQDATNRVPAKALERARAELHKQGVRFPTFDIAFAVYWKLANPLSPLSLSELRFMDEGEIAGDLISALAEVPVVGLIAKIPRVLHSLGQTAREWWTKRGQQELGHIAALDDANEVAEWLPAFFGADLRAWLDEKAGRRAVVFLDTHEALFTERGSGQSGDAPDAWVRDWAAHLINVLVVIGGRSKLRWTEADPAWEAFIEQHLVGRLSEEDSERFLASAGISEAGVRATIVAKSQGVPQYLGLAVDTYEKIRAAEGRSPRPEEFDGNLGKLLARFLSYVGDAQEAAFYVLSVPERFDRNRFNDLMRVFATGVAADARGLASVTRYSIVDEPTPGWYSLHALVREALAAHHDQADRAAVHLHLFKQAQAVLQETSTLAITEEARQALREGVQHGQVAMEPLPFMRWYRSAQKPFDDAAEWRLLHPLQEAVVAFAEDSLGPDHPETLEQIDALALLLRERGHLADAEPLHRRALHGLERVLGPDHPDTIGSVSALASTLHLRGNLHEAESLHRRALEGAERSLGPDHPMTLSCVSNLGLLLQARGRLSDAENLCRRALDGAERVLGPDHPDTFIAVNALACILQAGGKLEGAEPLFLRAIKAQERILGPDHPSTLTSVNNLGSVLQERGRLNETELLYQRALQGFERVLGPDHPSTLTSVNNLGFLLHARGESEAAEPLCRRALQGLERVLGLDHPDTRTAFNNLARLLRESGQSEGAVLLYRHALEARERVLGPDHLSTLSFAGDLGFLLEMRGQMDAAIALYRRHVEGWERAVGPDDPEVQAKRNYLAKLLRDSEAAGDS